MSEQEMQFADPEWRPPEDGMVQARQEAPEPYVAQPINRGPREPAMWQTGASTSQSDVPPLPVQPGPYADGYTPQQVAGSYTDGYTPQQVRGRQYGVPGRKSRKPWLWVIIILIGFSVMSGGFGKGLDLPGHDHQSYIPPWMHSVSQSYAVSGVPTIVIHGHLGRIHVNTGDANKVIVDMPNKDGVRYDKDSNQLTVNMDSFGDLNVTVPSKANLQIDTQNGDIDVHSVNGQMTLTSNSGTITVDKSTLTGQSVLKSDNGAVSFDGSFDPSGSYQFESNSGSVDVTLPASASFHVDVSTNSGSINSDFSSVAVQQVGSNGAQAHGDVGTQPRPVITLKTDNGDIQLHRPS